MIRTTSHTTMKHRQRGGYHALLLWCFSVLYAASLLLPLPAHAAAPPAGTVIENIASLFSKLNLVPEKSNAVHATVQATAECLNLTNDQQISSQLGSQVAFTHLVSNCGASPVTITLAVATASGSDFTLQNLTLYRKPNGTALIDPKASSLAPTDQITLNPGEVLSLLAVGTVPYNAPVPGTSKFTLTARSSNGLAATNTDTVVIPVAECLKLVSDQQITALPGAPVAFRHQLSNCGNMLSTVSLSAATLSGSNFTTKDLALYRDLNNNGILDPGEPVIADTDQLTLAPGETVGLLLTGTVPDTPVPSGTSRLLLSARTKYGTSTSNTDTIIVKRPAVLEMSKTATPMTVVPGGEITFTVSTTNTGETTARPTATANGGTIVVDSVPTPLVLVRDIIPANTSYVRGSLQTIGSGGPLYHRTGDPPYSYTRTEPADVDEVAEGLLSLNPGASTGLVFRVKIHENAGGSIVNSGQGYYNNGAVTDVTSVISNVVVITLPLQLPTINFFTDDTFGKVAVAYHLGSPLYVQASAAMCNTDPATAERRTVTISSALTGDAESYDATETAPNSGVFRIVPAVQTRNGKTEPVVHGDGIVSELGNDTLTARIEGCGATATATVRIDPQGVVFNSLSDAPIANASVTIIDVTGSGNGGNPGGPATVYDTDGKTTVPATVTTGVDGVFEFPLVPAGTYRLAVVPPNGNKFPSKVPVAAQPADRTIDPSGSYGSSFTVDTAGAISTQAGGVKVAAKDQGAPAATQVGFVTFDVPVDNGPASGLFVEKVASVKLAELGDFVDYAITIQNNAGKLLTEVMLNDTLPAGFSYQPGSARLGGAPVADPAGSGRGPQLVFPVGKLDAGASVVMTYRVKIGPGAVAGNGINYAQATASYGTVSNVASAQVVLQGGVFSDKGYIIGKIFLDCNRNRLQDKEELGIPGVRLYMEDGTFVITDSEGKFSLYGITNRTHVLKIDKTTLPAGAELIDLSNRNGGDAGSRFIDMKSGELHKADFALGACPAAVVKEVKERRTTAASLQDEGERSLIKPLTIDQLTINDIRGLPSSGIIGADGQTAPPQASPGTTPQPAQLPPTAAVALAAGRPSALAELLGHARGASDVGDIPDASPFPRDTAGIRPQGPTRESATQGVAAGPASLSPVSLSADRGVRQPAVPRPQKELEELLPDMGASLDFIGLRDNEILPVSQIRVRVKGPSGGALKFLVNGVEIADDRVGKKVVDDKRRIEAREYIGVDLKAGPNRLQLVLIDSFGNRRGDKSITVTAPGKPAKIIISLPEKHYTADGRTPLPVQVRLVDENGIPVRARTPLTLESSVGRWQATDLDEKEPGTQVEIAGGSAEYPLLPPTDPGEGIIRISSNGIKTETRIYFYPDLRPLIAAGLLEGTLNLRNIGKNAFSPNRNQDGFEQEIRNFSFSGNDDKVQGAARSAVFMKGRVLDDYLLTLSYDSDKDPKETLFRDIQPDQFYPVYGDSSVKGFEAQSTSKLYLRVDKNKSYFQYGDFITPPGGDIRVLGAYNRSLTGYRLHYENTFVSANGFASQDSTTQIIEEIPGQGVSGPYLLKSSSFVANSETVEIITRDRNQPDLIIKTVSQTRFTDYEIEENTGRLLFRAPIPSLDTNMNPNFIRVTYESDQGGDRFWVAGGDAQVKLHDRLEVGGSYVRDENPQDKADLASANVTVKLAEKTFAIGEWAQSSRESVGRGDAVRFELRHDDGRLQVKVYGVKTDKDFDNPSSGIARGQTEGGVKFAFKVDKDTSITGEAIHNEDSIANTKRDGILANIEHAFGTYLKAELGVRHSRDTSVPTTPDQANSTNEVTSLRTKLTGQLPSLPKLSLIGEYEQSLTSSARVAALGSDYKLNDKMRLYVRHEFINSLNGPYALNGSQQQNSTLAGVDTEYMKDGKLFSEYRIRDAIDGRDSEAAIGLRNVWNLAKGVRLNTTFERIQRLGGVADNTATAVTGAIEYTASPLWKGTARLELRTSTTADTVLNTLGVAYKLNRNFTLLGKQILSYSGFKGSQTGDHIQERLQAGFAYRPTDTDTWNALAKYEFKYENDDSQPVTPLNRSVHIVSVNLNYQPTKALTTSAHYAGKLVSDESNNITSSSNTHLLSGRTIYDLTERWDAGLNYSALFSDLFKSCRYGVGGEVGYMVAANLWLSGGYNIFGFRDKDLGTEDYTGQGVYFRLRFKFDEELFAWSDPKVNKALPAPTPANTVQ